MPKIKITREKLLELYDSFIKTGDPLTALLKNPEYILLFRFSMGYSQTEFERFIGISKNISKYETGKIKRLQKKTAMKILNKVKTIKFSKSDILHNFEKSLLESKGWFGANKNEKADEARIKGALRAAIVRRHTEQEKDIATVLESIGVNFKTNWPITRKSIVDFYLQDLNLIIECKRLKTFNRKEQTSKIRELAYQGYKIKFANKNVKLIAVIETNLPLQRTDFEELKGPFDLVCKNKKELYIYLTSNQPKSVWP